MLSRFRFQDLVAVILQNQARSKNTIGAPDYLTYNFFVSSADAKSKGSGSVCESSGLEY